MADTPKNSPSSVLEQFKEMQDGALTAPTLSPQEIMANIIAQARQEKKTQDLLGRFDGIMNMLGSYVNTNIAQKNTDFDLNVNLSVATDISEALEDKGPVRIRMMMTTHRSGAPQEPEDAIISDYIIITPVAEGFQVDIKRETSLPKETSPFDPLKLHDVHPFELSRTCANFAELDAFLSMNFLLSAPPELSKPI